MKKMLSFALALSMMMLLLAGCGDKAAEPTEPTEVTPDAPVETRVIQLGHIDSEVDVDPYNLLATYFAQNLSELSGGAFEIDIIGDAQLGAETAMVEGMKMQTVDAAIISNFSYSGFVSGFATFDMPYLFENKDQAHAVMDSEEILGELKQKLYDEYDVKLLSYGDGGFRSVISTVKTVEDPADLTGLKIRVPGNETYLDAFKAFGAAPVTMSSSECIAGLQQGTVDAMEQPIVPMYTYGSYEICSYICLTEHIFNPISLTVSKSLWESLTEEEQGWFQQAATEAAKQQRADLDQIEVETLDKMVTERGIKVNEISDKTAFREAAAAAYEKYYAAQGHDLMDKVDAVIESVG